MSIVILKMLLLLDMLIYLYTPQSKVVKRSTYANSTINTQEIVEYHVIDIYQTVIYQLPERVLSDVLYFSPITIIQKIFKISIQMRNIDQA